MNKKDISDADVTRAMLREAVNIESRIEELEASEYVRLARRYNEVKGQRIAYLQELKQQARFGKRLHDMGWSYTPEVYEE